LAVRVWRVLSFIFKTRPRAVRSSKPPTTCARRRRVVKLRSESFSTARDAGGKISFFSPGARRVRRQRAYLLQVGTLRGMTVTSHQREDLHRRRTTRQLGGLSSSDTHRTVFPSCGNSKSNFTQKTLNLKPTLQGLGVQPTNELVYRTLFHI